MLKIQRFVCNMFGENTYVVSDETKECLFVDCGAFYPEERAAIRRYVQEEQLKPVSLICTHGHLDHVLGNSFLYDEYDGLYTDGDHSLYVNIGLGGTMPMRIGATPEITLITLKAK